MGRRSKPAQPGRAVVSSIVESELADLSRLWRAGSADEHNVFLKAISPSLAAVSRPTRQLTSRLGGRLARIARKLAEARYDSSAVPQILVHADVGKFAPPASTKSDCLIYTNLNEEVARTLTSELIATAGSSRGLAIGTDGFRDQYEAASRRLAAAGRSRDVWRAQVDLAVLDKQIGFAELESGGQLDTSNAIGQSRKLVLAGLAYGKPDLPLHFCCAYANAGEDRPLLGSLGRYLASATGLRDGLLVGSQWWGRVLPSDVTFEDFLRVFHEVASKYAIAGPLK